MNSVFLMNLYTDTHSLRYTLTLSLSHACTHKGSCTHTHTHTAYALTQGSQAGAGNRSSRFFILGTTLTSRKNHLGLKSCSSLISSTRLLLTTPGSVLTQDLPRLCSFSAFREVSPLPFNSFFRRPSRCCSSSSHHFWVGGTPQLPTSSFSKV